MRTTVKGGSGKYTYSYIVYNKDTDTWFRLADNIEADTFKWISTSRGSRVFYIEVKDSEGTIVRSKALNINVTDEENALSMVGEASASNTKVGDKVTFSATAKGGSEKYTYSYIVYNKDNGTWFRLADNIESNTFEWVAGSVGNRVFYIDVKDSEGTIVRSEAIEVATNDELALSIVGKATSNEINVGDTVTVQGIATGGTSPYTYSILVHNKANDSWYRFSGFSDINELIWTASSVGEREFFVEVKDCTDKVVRSSAVIVNVK